jgi:hypothetical protein
MTLVRPTTIIAGTLGSSAIEPRWRLALTGMQIARTPSWSKKPFVLRNVPYTAVTPKPQQLAVRIAFGEIASMAKGKKKEGFLPPAAEIVKEAAGQIAGATAGIPSQRDMRRTLHTVEELRAIAKQKKIEVVSARAAYALART